MKSEEQCTKIGKRVMEVLHTKHPEARPLSMTTLETYPYRQPELASVYITEETVTGLAGRLHGGASIGWIDSVSLQHWFLIFRATIR